MVDTVRFFSLQNAVSFIILTYLVSVLFTFYIQCVLKLKKKNSGAKRLSYGRWNVYWLWVESGRLVVRQEIICTRVQEAGLV